MFSNARVVALNDVVHELCAVVSAYGTKGVELLKLLLAAAVLALGPSVVDFHDGWRLTAAIPLALAANCWRSMEKLLATSAALDARYQSMVLELDEHLSTILRDRE